MTAVRVTFAYTWITHPASGSSVSGPNPVRSGNAALAGSFRTYAGGRTRVITTPGDTRTTPGIVLQGLHDVDLSLLDAWRGQLVLLRDAMGWRKWGSYLDLKWNDVPGPAGMIHDATLVFQEITYAEAV